MSELPKKLKFKPGGEVHPVPRGTVWRRDDVTGSIYELTDASKASCVSKSGKYSCKELEELIAAAPQLYWAGRDALTALLALHHGVICQPTCGICRTMGELFDALFDAGLRGGPPAPPCVKPHTQKGTTNE